MPNKDKTGPEGKGAKTGRGVGNCETTEKQTTEKQTTEKQLDNQRGKGRGPCGDGKPRGGNGQGNGRGNGQGRRKGADGITHF